MGITPRNGVDKMGIKTVDKMGIDEMGSSHLHIQCSNEFCVQNFRIFTVILYHPS